MIELIDLSKLATTYNWDMWTLFFINLGTRMLHEYVYFEFIPKFNVEREDLHKENNHKLFQNQNVYIL